MDLELAGDAVLVAGGSAGVGRAGALAFAREGADVAVAARNADRLQDAREAIDDAGDGNVLAVQGDVTDDQGDVDAYIEDVTAAFDGLDHLVLATSGPRTAEFAATVDRDWYTAYDLVVMSAVRLVRIAYPYLREDGGTVTVVACTAAREVRDEAVLTNALQRATVGLVDTLARELAPEIRCNAVLAGASETDAGEGVEDAVEHGDVESTVPPAPDDVPLGRLAAPREVGDAVAFLASERAGYVTGTAMPVDGGYHRS